MWDHTFGIYSNPYNIYHEVLVVRRPLVQEAWTGVSSPSIPGLLIQVRDGPGPDLKGTGNGTPNDSFWNFGVLF